MSHPNHLADAAILAGGSITWWAWLAENHDAVTSICAIVGAVGVIAGLLARFTPPLVQCVKAMLGRG